MEHSATSPAALTAEQHALGTASAQPSRDACLLDVARAFVFAAQRATLFDSQKRRDAQGTMSAFGQKVAAPVRTYEEEMKFLQPQRRDVLDHQARPLPNMRVKRGVPSYVPTTRVVSKTRS